MEEINENTIGPILENMIVLVLFIVLFMIITNRISSKKRRLN